MENFVSKGEIACNKQFLLFSQCFLPYMALIFHFKCTFKCRLLFVSIWTSLKILSSSNGLIVINCHLIFQATIESQFDSFKDITTYTDCDTVRLCCTYF